MLQKSPGHSRVNLCDILQVILLITEVIIQRLSSPWLPLPLCIKFMSVLTLWMCAFNISQVTKWRNNSVGCAPNTVFEALGWIHSLNTSPGSDLLTALEAAFADPLCHAVHLLTTALPDHPENFLSGLSAMTLRPVHVFLLSQNSQLDGRTLDFVQCFTSATGGSCHLLLLGLNGSIEKVSIGV